MAFTEFCCRSGGSNLNAGTRTGNSTEPGTSADFTYASGNWVAATGVFTVASGNPSSDGVAVGDFASVYADGSAVTGFVGRVTARDATTITVSLTAKAGTAPTDGTGNRTLKIGGAWKGPNAAEAFPFGFVQNTLTDSTGNYPRVNFKNAAQYDITAAITHANNGPIVWQGYTTSYGDLGKATIDGGTSGSGYTLLTVSGTNNDLYDFIFANNGASSTGNGLVLSGQESNCTRVVVHDLRGSGIVLSGGGVATECEVYAFGKNNSATGIVLSGSSSARRCITHDSGGTGCNGFSTSGGGLREFDHCIADTVSQDGFNIASDVTEIINCDAYNCTRDGVRTSGTNRYTIENCNFVKNGGYGINFSANNPIGQVTNCGFGAGTQANTSGQINYAAVNAIVESGNVTYASDVTPWVDPANGDFRINLATAKGAGRGTFTQTAASYAGTIGYPDIGAAQHLDSGTTSGGYVIGA